MRYFKQDYFTVHGIADIHRDDYLLLPIIKKGG
jgi:hypothetical protein